MTQNHIIVPKALIKYHHPHPEYYGESIVTLLNDMVTDVYTNDDGDLFTITNEEELIQYLQSHQEEETIYNLTAPPITLRTTKNDDTTLLHRWMNKPSNYRYNDLPTSIQDVREFVSHSFTMYSHLFLIINNAHPVGYASYHVIEQEAIIMIKIYEKKHIVDTEIDIAMKLLSQHITSLFPIGSFVSFAFIDDFFTIHLLTRNGFTVNPNKTQTIYVGETETKKELIFYRSL